MEALYRLRHQPGAQGFAAAWEAAVDRGMARLEDCALERAIAGEERVMIRRGEVVARWTRYDTPLLVFLLRNRRRGRFGQEALLSRAEWEAVREAEEAGEAEVVLERLNAKLDAMRARMAAAAETAAAEEDATPGEEGAGEEPADDQAAGPAGGRALEVKGLAGMEAACGAQPAGGAARMLPGFLRQGDAGVGMPRIDPGRHPERLIGRSCLRPQGAPASAEEEMVRGWMQRLAEQG
ncbi:MAG TPA: hypothetical protein VFF98_11085 [Novosphingobium sp.]|nr:hypothetical protein [Novosphingobium sp.]